MKIVFFGTPQFVVPVLETLIKHFNVVGVVTTPDERVGRKQLLTPSPVKAYALTKNIPVFQPDTIAALQRTATEKLSHLSPDLFVVAAYGKIIPLEVLSLPPLGSINIHPSRLPDYRGPSPLQETLLAGEKETAVTIIKMDEDVDHGPVLAQESIAIDPLDTFLTLAQKTFKLGASMLLPTIEKLHNGRLELTEQDHAKATFTSHIAKNDGFFMIDSPPSPEQLDRMIRAYYPWPTVWTRIKIKNQESRIMKLLPNNQVQLEGGKPMSVKDFLNGYPELTATIYRLFPTSH